MDLTRSVINPERASVGRGLVFYHADSGGDPTRWDPEQGDEINLVHLGDTEGDITITPNAEVVGLTLPEITGPAMHTADFTGENPTIEIPLYLADPALLTVISPSASPHGGNSMRQPAREVTLVVLPEGLFLKENADGTKSRATLSFDGGTWEIDGDPLSARQEELLAMAHWFWRCVFNRPPRRFRGGPGNDSKNIETVTAMALHHEAMPEGHALFTVGDPAEASIDIEGGS